MQLNDAMNLVIPLRSDDRGVQVYGYHTPISREVFEANFMILAATRATMAAKGVQFMMGSGPSVAALILKDEAKKDAESRGDFDDEGKPSDRAAKALLAELKRLTTLVAPGPNGWDMIPVEAALSKGIIDADDWREAESALVFFTCHYALAKRAERALVVPATARVLTGLNTSSTLSEFVNSLQTSMQAETSAQAAGSSVPS